MNTPFASLSRFVCLATALAACGGIVEPSSTGNPGASSTTSTPTPRASGTPASSSTAAPPNPPNIAQPPPGDGVSCWSPGPADSGSQATDAGTSIDDDAASPIDAGTTFGDATCSLVGTWDYSVSGGASGSLSFDAFGNWVGSDSGGDLCNGSTMHGTYTLSGTEFQLVTIHDASECGGDWGMGFTPTFNAACTSAHMKEVWDNCTGARTEFNYDPTLTKR